MTERMNGYYAPLVHIADAQDEGRMLRDVLRSRLGVSRRLWVRLKTTEAGVTINGEKAYSSARLSIGDRIELRMSEEESDDILPQPMALDIVFEDEHLLVLNKPAGLIVHPTTGHYANTLANGVVHYWRERGERCRFRPVHRLDEDTSGLVVVAKHPYAHQQLSVQMMAGTVEKKYRAYVYGEPPASRGEVNAPIGRVPEDPHRRAVLADGQPSLTYYEVARTYACGASALDVRLGTGRTHQIRVHLGSVGCPLIGDDYYADPAWSSTELSDRLSGVVGRQALHAALLAFRHPVTDEPLTLVASLPDDLRALEAALTELPAGLGVLGER
ncbi:RluA family pseudouridine synthase [Cohnella sp. REN36]|uniref:RluA family pseudouridine synthase n=1 Tax=Cohnella sp. REN36 TaxID=2887347 RepID=UPI001D158EEC|nr:RluA family pseudouridine synthase [Cohnella sp. REN36]MCC3374870.1 RluA family pseudouridine synthase [Cohnella sp. REN36]